MADNLMDILNEKYSEHVRKSDGTYKDGDLKNTNDKLVKKYDLTTNKDGGIRGMGASYKKEVKEIEKTLANLKKEEAKRYKDIFKQELELGKYSTRLKNDGLKKEIESYTHLYNIKKNTDAKLNAILQEQAKAYKDIGLSGKASLGNLAKLYTKRKEIEKLEKDSLEYKEQQFEKGVDKVKNGITKVVDTVFNYINKRDDLMKWDQWKAGISDLGTQYEKNFTEIAARNGSETQMETHNLIDSALKTIVNDGVLSKGLNFNNEVLPEITEAVKNGFTGNEAVEIAISNAVDKKITPWLDTSSETWVNLQYQLSDDMLAQIKGQQLLLQETREGNRILQNGVVSTLLDELAPTLLNIDANTTDVNDLSGQAQAMVASLMDNGYSKQDAIKVANQTIDAYQNPFANLSEGSSTWQKLLAIGGLQGGDLASAMNFATGAISPFNDGNWATAGAAEKYLGIPSNGFTRNTDYISDLIKAAEATDKYETPEDLEKVYTSKLLGLNEYTTATQQNDNNEQNWMANQVMMRNLVAHGVDLAEEQLNAVQDLKRWLITTFLAGLVSSLLGKGLDALIGMFSKSKIGGTGLNAAKSMMGGGGTTSAGGGIPPVSSAGGAGAEAGKTALSTGSKVFITGASIVGGAAGAYTGISQTYEKTAQDYSIGLQGKDLLKGTDEYDRYEQALKKDLESERAGSTTGGIIGGAAGAAGGAAIGAAIGSVVPVFGTAIGAAVGGLIGFAGGLLGAKIGEAAGDTVAPLKDVLSMATVESVQQLDLMKVNWQEELLERENLVSAMKTTTDIEVQKRMLLDAGIDQNLINMAKTDDALDKLAESALNATQDTSELAIASKNIVAGMSQDVNSSTMGNIATHILNLDKDARASGMYELLDAANLSSEDEARIRKQIDDTWWWGISDDEVVQVVGAIQAAANQSNMQDIVGYYRYDVGLKGLGHDDANIAYVNELNDAIMNQDKEAADKALRLLASDKLSSGGHALDSFKNHDFYVNALKDLGIDIKAYKLGSLYIPNDSIAFLHSGERVLTADQNEQYTRELVTGESTSSIIRTGIQDIILAIKTQTSDIINYLSTMNFNNSSFGNSHVNMLPTMGNTKVTI